MSTPTPRAITREIARVIKGRMASYDVSQGELAAYVGVDQSQLSKMIRGLRQINIDQLDRMCHMLDLDLGEVVTTASRFVRDRDWPGEPWITPFIIDGERVSRSEQTEPSAISAEEEKEMRKSDVAPAARRGKRKGDAPHAE